MLQTRPSRIGRRELLTGFPLRESPYWIRIHRRAMACRFEVTLSGDDAAHVPAAQGALAEATRLEEQLSVFRATSELSRVNERAAERPVNVSPELFALLTLCRHLHAESRGAFDITTTPLSRCWGFLDRRPAVPDAAVIEAVRACVGLDAVDLEDGAVRFRRPGVELNLGAIGKGYAVERIAALLRASGVRHALVSAGGSSVRALGGRGEGWSIDVSSRAVGPDPIARLSLCNAALAISGIGEQWVAGTDRGRTGDGSGTYRGRIGDGSGTDPVRYGHVIDPRSGWPARGYACAAVVADDAAHADALSTAFLISGEDLARAYCDAHPGTLALLVPDGSTRPIVVGSHPGARVEDL